MPSHDGSTVNVITALAPLPHPGFSRSSPRSSRTSVSASTCRTATPPPARFRPRPRPAPPIRSWNSRCWTSTAGYQVRTGANEPRVTVPLNDHIDYEGGVVTRIDNLSGERPFGNYLVSTLNLDILEVSFRNATRWKIAGDADAAGDWCIASSHSSGDGRKRRVQKSALAYLLSSGALFAPISDAATPPSSRCRQQTQAVIDPGGTFACIARPGAGLCAGRTDRA